MAACPRLGPSRLLMAAVVAMAVTGLAGCQSGQGGDSAVNGIHADGFTAAFTAGRYDEAYRLAEPASASGDAGERERAALIAGMSASAMGKRDVAARWLTPLVSSTDRHISGKAFWTLGTIADSQKRQADAAKYYAEAGERLDGEDGAKAFTAAGDAYTKLRLDDQARAHYALAARKTPGASSGEVAEGSTAPRMAGGADGQSGAICTVVNVLPAYGGSSPAPSPSDQLGHADRAVCDSTVCARQEGLSRDAGQKGQIGCCEGWHAIAEGCSCNRSGR